MRKIALGAVLVSIALLQAPPNPSAANAGQQDQASLTKDASAAYEAKDWPKAAQLYQQLAEAQPQSPRLWYRLATSLHEIGEQEKAVAAYQKSIDAGLPKFLGEFQIALVYASMQNKEKSLEFLQKAATDGFNQPEQLSDTAEFANLRDDTRFTKALEQTKRNQKPFAYAPENRQFDFWLGEWNVVTTQGDIPVGSSKIELILADCVVQENWTGNGGTTGKSYNIYNQALKRWEQYWVDSNGGNIFFYGGLRDGVMDYFTDEIPQPNGPKLKRHLQFFHLGPDKVRQFSQGSSDGGKTWQVEYDFTYNRKK